MTTTYYIGSNEVETSNAIGVSVERYHTADYWKIRLYMQDTLSATIMSELVPNLTSSITIDDGSVSITYSGTIGYFETSENYTLLDLLNCTVTVS